MDISGVDVDFLSNEELLELCNDIVDNESEEISVLKGVDVNNLSDDKIQDIYDDMIYGSQVSSTANKVISITDRQVLDINYNIVDMDANEISLLNGQNINVDNLSEEELLSLYNESLESDTLIAGTCYDIGIWTSGGTVSAIQAYCHVPYSFDNDGDSETVMMYLKVDLPTPVGQPYTYYGPRSWYDAAVGKGGCDFECKYKSSKLTYGVISCYSTIYGEYQYAGGYNKQVYMEYNYLCK